MTPTPQFTPAPGFVLVKPFEEEKSTFTHVRGATSSEPPRKGTVISCGASYITEFNAPIKCPVKKDQVISHTTIGYEEIVVDNESYRVVPFVKIIGIWDKKVVN